MKFLNEARLFKKTKPSSLLQAEVFITVAGQFLGTTEPPWKSLLGKIVA
jgi:hypothetical protein